MGEQEIKKQKIKIPVLLTLQNNASQLPGGIFPTSISTLPIPKTYQPLCPSGWHWRCQDWSWWMPSCGVLALGSNRVKLPVRYLPSCTRSISKSIYRTHRWTPWLPWLSPSQTDPFESEMPILRAGAILSKWGVRLSVEVLVDWPGYNWIGEI